MRNVLEEVNPRTPQKTAPREPSTGWDWSKLATGALGLAGLGAILGSARFNPAVQTKLYRDWMKLMSREGALHTVPDVAGDWVNRLMRGPWWHGSPEMEKILETGFNPVKAKTGLRFGEPAGVSLSASPSASLNFANDPRLLRVWPRLDPKSVLPAWSDEAAEPLIKAYLEALDSPVPQGTQSIRDFLSQYHYANAPNWSIRHTLGDLVGTSPEVVQAFNEALSKRLMKQGVQGLLYSPHRYNEYELRVLDPGRAIPMEWRKVANRPRNPNTLSSPGDWQLLDWESYLPERQRYIPEFNRKKYDKEIVRFSHAVPTSRPKSLSDLYEKHIPAERIVGPGPANKPGVADAIFEPQATGWNLVPPPTPGALAAKTGTPVPAGAQLPGNITIAEAVKDLWDKGGFVEGDTAFWAQVASNLHKAGFSDLASFVNAMPLTNLNNVYGSLLTPY